MLISNEELRRLSISTWPRVIGASVVCLVSMGLALLMMQFVGGGWHLFTAVPLMLGTFGYAGLSLIMTSNYRKVLNRGPGRDKVLDEDDLFRRFIIREEVK